MGGACVGDVGETVGTLLAEFYGLASHLTDAHPARYHRDIS